MITRILLAEILRFAENFGSLRGVGDSKVLFFYKKNKTLTKQKTESLQIADLQGAKKIL